MTITRETIFSPDRVYRYTLWRDLCGLRFLTGCKEGYVQFIGLNPSTADEFQDDPTIRRCMRFVKDWGYSEFCMTNIFAFRATDPAVMEAHPEPVGEDNDQWILEIASGAAMVVAAWGTHGIHRKRGENVQFLFSKPCADIPLHHLGLTKDGHPKHPLYLRADTKPVEWRKNYV